MGSPPALPLDRGRLLENPEPEVGQLPGLGRACLLELDLMAAGTVEQADSVAEQDGPGR
jgi:hypothetical protein